LIIDRISNLLVIFVPVIERRHAGDFFEGAAKGFRVGIADVEHHFGDVFAARFEAFFGGFDLDALDVFADGVIGRFFEAALEAAAAERAFR